jgi:TPP-dependent pyruvate/acetoin dehydrogenase alpha subunit
VAPGEIEQWATTNDPIDRYVVRLTTEFGVAQAELDAIDAAVAAEVDAATDVAEASPPCDGPDALVGVYADPPRMPTLWFRDGVGSAVAEHERPASWGTHHG